MAKRDAKVVEEFIADVREYFRCYAEDEGGHDDPMDCWHCSAVYALKALRRSRHPSPGGRR
jgi:hypothetical protein